MCTVNNKWQCQGYCFFIHLKTTFHQNNVKKCKKKSSNLHLLSFFNEVGDITGSQLELVQVGDPLGLQRFLVRLGRCF